MKKIIPFAALGLALACDPGPQQNDPPVDDNVACEDGVCVLSGTITEDLTLTADKAWLLRGGVFIGDDEARTVLTIEPGTTIFGESSTVGMLVIRRGSQIIAEGTEDAPIIFTSSKDEGTRARGDWGGLIINGRAPINGCDTTSSSQAGPCEAFGEGGTGFYGADDPDDNSGVLKYVRVEFAGNLISPDNELNGVAFQGVGRGTTIDFLQVHMAKDDCVEFFGGTAEAKHILCTGIADDNLDWTDGWTGKLQFFVAQQYEDAGDNGIEADNNGEDNGALPRSRPTLANLTLIGAPGSDASDLGMLLREGTAANLYNVVALGWGEGCMDVDHDETFSNAMSGEGFSGALTIEASLFDCDTNFVEEEGDLFTVQSLFEAGEGNEVVDPELEAPFDPDAPGLSPLANGPSLIGARFPAGDSFFEQVSFKGGVGPIDDWTQGWTISVRQ